MIPELNDSEENLNATGDFLSKLYITKVVVLPYHSMAKSKYVALGLTYTLSDIEPPSAEKLDNAVSILKRYGLNAISGLK